MPTDPELRTAGAWCVLLDWHILDPDGWREDGLSWDAPITRDDFERRAAMSTARGPRTSALSVRRAQIPDAREAAYEAIYETYGQRDNVRAQAIVEAVLAAAAPVLLSEQQKRIEAAEAEAQQWEASADGYRRMFDEQCSRASRFRALLALFVDNEDCRFDHHGNCQNHGIGWDDESPGECSMVAVRAALGSSGQGGGDRG